MRTFSLILYNHIAASLHAEMLREALFFENPREPPIPKHQSIAEFVVTNQRRHGLLLAGALTASAAARMF